jgi:7,8-dihydropterin-6-yl-methyl-4-(beta-D-ribofuranosyl)aminobenzene 5'-phosphate synthase
MFMGIDCGEEFVLIDSGVGRETQGIVENLVADGIELTRVQRLLLTHGHLDHSGGARYLRDKLKLQLCASSELHSPAFCSLAIRFSSEAGFCSPLFMTVVFQIT